MIDLNSAIDLLDNPISSSEEDWDDYCDPISLIEQANKTFNLLDYIETKYTVQIQTSSNGWTRRMFCPFHKNGHERTPSLFINTEKNVFYCQACGASGGLVQFISNLTNRSEDSIANDLIKIGNNGQSILSKIEAEKKLEQKRKVFEFCLKISSLFHEFIKNHIDDDEGLKYIDKLMVGFDNVFLLNPEDTEKNIEEIFNNFQTYLSTYDKRT